MLKGQTGYQFFFFPIKNSVALGPHSLFSLCLLHFLLDVQNQTQQAHLPIPPRFKVKEPLLSVLHLKGRSQVLVILC